IRVPEQPDRQLDGAGRRAVQVGEVVDDQDAPPGTGLVGREVRGGGGRAGLPGLPWLPWLVTVELDARPAGRVRADDVRQVLVDGGPADAHPPGDAGDRVLRPEKQITYLAQLTGREGRRTAEPLPPG